MTETEDGDEGGELSLAPALRGRLYRERVEALEAELAATNLPNLRAKLRAAADRFVALAETSERLANRSQRPFVHTDRRDARIKEVLEPFSVLLRGPASNP
jgi:hypothetical protein